MDYTLKQQQHNAEKFFLVFIASNSGLNALKCREYKQQNFKIIPMLMLQW